MLLFYISFFVGHLKKKNHSQEYIIYKEIYQYFFFYKRVMYASLNANIRKLRLPTLNQMYYQPFKTFIFCLHSRFNDLQICTTIQYYMSTNPNLHLN